MKSELDSRKAQPTGDTLPDQAGVYVPPRPVAPLSDHRTMDVKAIRLAAELDPRQAMTQLRIEVPKFRRGPSLLTLLSIAVLLLAGVVIYVTLESDAPLPLAPSPREPIAAPARPAAPAARATTPIVPPPALTTPSAAATTTPGAAPALPDGAHSESASTAAATAAPTPRPTPRPRKASRDPWLE